MAIKLNGSTDGSVSLDAPADTSPSGTDVTLTLPTSAGSSGQFLQTNGSGTLSWSGQIKSKTAQTISGSPSAVSFTELPANIQRLVVTLNNVDPAGNELPIVQLGTSSDYKTSGYDSHGLWTYGTNQNVTSESTGFQIPWSGASSLHGAFEIQRHSGNIFVCRSQMYVWDGTNVAITHQAGIVDLGGELERVQLTLKGTDTYSSGSVNVHWEV